jgi:hypothetical protein
MGSAKAIELRPISGAVANDLVRRLHYSRSVVQNSQLHIGVFRRGRLHGAMQYGPPMDRRKLLGLVADLPWAGLVELNRMAFDDEMPRNSESRALAIAARLIRRDAPHVEVIVSFADAAQCGDGTIYRAAGFVLTGISRSRNLARLPDGTTVHKMTWECGGTVPRPEFGGRSYFEITGGRYNFRAAVAAAGGDIVPGHQLRYMQFVNPAARARLTVPEIPYDELRRRGISMYRGTSHAPEA